MIKLVISDMDGTLLDDNKNLSLENLDAIQKLRDNNIRFCIATGRSEQLIKEYIRPLNMKDPMILNNGSVISNPFENVTLYRKHFTHEDLKNIIAYCEAKDAKYSLYTKDFIISKPDERVKFFSDRQKDFEEDEKTVFKDIRDLNEILSYPISKVLIINKDNQDELTEMKNHFLPNENLQVTLSQHGFLDLNPQGTSKGEGVKILCEELGYDLSEVCTIGDQGNDIPMLEVSGMSIAMANATDEAKNVADYVTKSNNESGFAYFVNEILLKSK